MEVSSTQKFVHMTPRKVRLVVAAIRGKTPGQALVALDFMTKRASTPVEKALKSAIANATNNAKIDPEELRIKAIEVQEGPRLKRFRPVSRGMAHGYVRRMSHIKITLEEKS